MPNPTPHETLELNADDIMEIDCARLEQRGEVLRAAVAWRFVTGQEVPLCIMTGVRMSALVAFVERGELSEADRVLLEVSRG